MSRKDYALIANAIHAAPVMDADRIDIALPLAEALAESNPRFDAAKFVYACRYGA